MRSRRALLLGGGQSINLLRDLSAYWKLDEASGDRADSVGSRNLVEYGTVTQETGIVANAAGYDGDLANYLYTTGHADINLGVFDWSIVFWTYLADHATYGLMNKGTGRTVSTCICYVARDVATSVVVKFNTGADFIIVSPGSIPDITWTMIHIWYDAANDRVGSQLNAGIKYTDTLGGTFVSDNFNLYFGKAGSNPFSGRCDEAGIWKRLLSNSEINRLYNSGAGRTYPF